MQNQRPKYLKSLLGCRSLCFDPKTSVLLQQLAQEVALHKRPACMFREHIQASNAVADVPVQKFALHLIRG